MTADSPLVVRHFFTVDVEEHFQVSAFEDVIHPGDWPHHESRVDRNVDVLLDLLARHDTAATFFVLGWVAERRPDLVRRIAGAGHEVASHGHDHRRVTRQNPTQFRASVARAKRVLEDVSGKDVVGFRAPSFSIVPGLEWAFDVLLEEGYRYDSSLFPVHRPGGYGYAGAQREPYWIERPSGRLYELPLATLRRFGWNLPAAGGAYLRLMPFGLVRSAFADFERRGIPGVFYVHPWEIDPAQPRIRASTSARVRHYTGLHRTAGRLERLLEAFRFGSIADQLRSAAPQPV
jgi:polysaccharide deacetylase family protein (PEP-CTERM system associated)